MHTRLCTYISTALQPGLPKGLRARAQEDVLLQADDDESSLFQPDVTIVETDELDESTGQPGGMAVALNPVLIRHVHFARRRRWVEILDSSDGNRVITAIEILSPGNKDSGLLNQKYLTKVKEYLGAGTNVVEIDLLRSSRKRLAVPSHEIPEERHAAYYTAICRAKDPTLWKLYPMPLRDPLPTIPIPCRPKDKDVPLALQPIICQIYIDGAHDDLNYTEPPEPPFSPADAEWAAALLKIRADQRK